ncbi:MAG: polysulfide reductase NrfD [Acidobacteria bacterium]|nr:polysulfide reductase NrfD [Acidobacteriota bacterium]
MRYGFLIDQRKCIGCHACTVACKAENNVPLGSFRTWVKYVEEGNFPNTERQFAVLRCNHCDNAPCVKICPVTALYTRPDGIVDFDQQQCIGCKACMQACPYDALYINSHTDTAEKCNFCAHRVEVGLQPACVIVCPEQAIVTGDLDNAESPISQLLSKERGVARKPEQGTRPKLYYLGSGKSVLKPELQKRDNSYLWSETGLDKQTVDLQQFISKAEAKARTAYDVPHHQVWGWRVWAYLWTKSIAAGVFFLPAFALIMGWQKSKSLLVASLISLIFQVVTGYLLVSDLRRPERFLRILLRPQRKSWLAIGAYILTAFGGVSSLVFVTETFSLSNLTYYLAIPGAILGILAAIYSGFLFAQAEGRDFWQSRLTTPHLFFQATLAGAGALGVIAPLINLLAVFASLTIGKVPEQIFSPSFIKNSLLVGLIGHLAIIVLEIALTYLNKPKPQMADARRAMTLLTHGPYFYQFWANAIFFGVLIPALFLTFGLSTFFASILALSGLYTYERLWITVGQKVPLS